LYKNAHYLAQNLILILPSRLMKCRQLRPLWWLVTHCRCLLIWVLPTRPV